MPASSPAESTLAGAVQLSTQQQGKTFLDVLQETHTPRSHPPAPLGSVRHQADSRPVAQSQQQIPHLMRVFPAPTLSPQESRDINTE